MSSIDPRLELCVLMTIYIYLLACTVLLLSRSRFHLLMLMMTIVIAWIQVMNPALQLVLMGGL